VAFALQDCESALFQEFAGDDVAYGPINQHKKNPELKSIVKNAMDLSGVPFAEFADRRIRELSGGEKRKVSLASVIALDSDILIFDEPTSALDPASQTSIMKTLRKLCDEGKTVLFSTHRLEEAAYADRCLTMGSGLIVSDTADNIEQTQANNCEKISVCEQIELLDSLRKNPEGIYTQKKIFNTRNAGLAKIHCIFSALYYSFVFFRF
jgi:energy-coupling factor transport system ATP-binding protein